MLSFSSSLIGKIAVGGGVCSTAATCGVVGYVYQDNIFGTGNSNAVFVAVNKDNTISQTANVGDLITTTGEKTNKNYKCKLSVDAVDYFDEDCVVIKWNQEATIKASSANVLDKQITTLSEFNKQTTAILKISKKFNRLLNTSGKSKGISIVKKDSVASVFGGFTKLFDVKETFLNPLTDSESSHFLMRIKEPVTSTTLEATYTNSFKCKIAGETSPLDCKIYKSGTNNATNDLAANVELTTFADADKVAGKYVVLEFTSSHKTIDQLKNKEVVIYKVVNEKTTLEDSNKLMSTTVDQVLFKNSSTDTTQTVSPLSPRQVSYLVKKASGGTFTDIANATKNYKCQFTDAENTNEDFSCVLKAFPTSSTSSNNSDQSVILNPTKALTPVETASNTGDHFILTLDANKLFNLRPDWTSPSKAVLVKTTDTSSEAKSTSFELVYELKDKKATDKVDMLLVRHNATANSAWILPNNKCGFANSETPGFDCTFYSVTETGSAKTPTATSGTAVELQTEQLTSRPHYVVKLTEPKNITDFDKNSIIYFKTNTGDKKLLFMIEARLGGEIGGKKILYYT